MTFWETNLTLLAGALLLEATIGYPQWLVDRIGHPVIWIGSLISLLDRRLNGVAESRSRTRGVLALIVLLVVATVAAFALQTGFAQIELGWLPAALVASTLIAQRSLHSHVQAVADALTTNGIEGARTEVAKIVGRDPSTLDEAGVARATIESLSENFSDGVIAPAFWLAVGGLPGIVLYKVINTADSMIGHRTNPYVDFGWASAHLDDWVNVPAARLTALILILASAVTPGANACRAATIARRDHGKHRSPNGGWPEAAMAGALGLRLSGPRMYDTVASDEPWIGDGNSNLTGTDIRRALQLYRVACGIFLAGAGIICAAILVGRLIG